MTGHESVQDLESQEKWRADLQLLVAEMPQRHPNLFFSITQVDFTRAVECLHDQIPTLTDNQIMVEFMKIGALVSRNGRDGHTMVLPGMVHFFPLKLYRFHDGLLVTDAQAPFQDLVGKQVVKIGHTDIEQVYQALDPLLARDNGMTVKWTMPIHLVMAEVLQGLGIIEAVEQGDFLLEDANGQRFTLNLPPIEGGDYGQWAGFPPDTLPQRPVPLFLCNLHERFWLTFLHEVKTLYIQFNEPRNETQSGESMTRFSERIAEFVTTTEVERTVIDLRHNYGGDNTTYGPLLHVISQTAAINQRGKLFTLIGRQTFSAGMNFVTDLAQNTHTLFVGEPTGGSPNHYGDAEPLLLPNAQLLMMISTRYHQRSAADDQRLWQAPDIPIAWSAQDFLANRDPVLAAALHYAI